MSGVPPLQSRVKVYYEDGWSFGTITAHVPNSIEITVTLDEGDIEDTLEYDAQTVILVKEEENDEENTNQIDTSREPKIGDAVEIYYEDGWNRGVVKELLGGMNVRVLLDGDEVEDDVELDGVSVRFVAVSDEITNAQNDLQGEICQQKDSSPTEQSMKTPKVNDLVKILYEDGWTECHVLEVSVSNNNASNAMLKVDLGDGIIDEVEYDGVGVVLLERPILSSELSSSKESIEMNNEDDDYPNGKINDGGTIQDQSIGGVQTSNETMIQENIAEQNKVFDDENKRTSTKKVNDTIPTKKIVKDSVLKDMTEENNEKHERKEAIEKVWSKKSITPTDIEEDITTQEEKNTKKVQSDNKNTKSATAFETSNEPISRSIKSKNKTDTSKRIKKSPLSKKSEKDKAKRTEAAKSILEKNEYSDDGKPVNTNESEKNLKSSEKEGLKLTLANIEQLPIPESEPSPDGNMIRAMKQKREAPMKQSSIDDTLSKAKNKNIGITKKKHSKIQQSPAKTIDSNKTKKTTPSKKKESAQKSMHECTKSPNAGKEQSLINLKNDDLAEKKGKRSQSQNENVDDKDADSNDKNQKYVETDKNSRKHDSNKKYSIVHKQQNEKSADVPLAKSVNQQCDKKSTATKLIDEKPVDQTLQRSPKKDKPKVGDKVKILYKQDGWLNATITQVKRRKKGETYTPVLVLLEKDNIEDEVGYDGEKVVIISDIASKQSQKSNSVNGDNNVLATKTNISALSIENNKTISNLEIVEEGAAIVLLSTVATPKSLQQGKSPHPKNTILSDSLIKDSAPSRRFSFDGENLSRKRICVENQSNRSSNEIVTEVEMTDGYEVVPCSAAETPKTVKSVKSPNIEKKKSSMIKKLSFGSEEDGKSIDSQIERPMALQRARGNSQSSVCTLESVKESVSKNKINPSKPAHTVQDGKGKEETLKTPQHEDIKSNKDKKSGANIEEPKTNDLQNKTGTSPKRTSKTKRSRSIYESSNTLNDHKLEIYSKGEVNAPHDVKMSALKKENIIENATDTPKSPELRKSCRSKKTKISDSPGNKTPLKTATPNHASAKAETPLSSQTTMLSHSNRTKAADSIKGKVQDEAKTETSLSSALRKSPQSKKAKLSDSPGGKNPLKTTASKNEKDGSNLLGKNMVKKDQSGVMLKTSPKRTTRSRSSKTEPQPSNSACEPSREAKKFQPRKRTKSSDASKEKLVSITDTSFDAQNNLDFNNMKPGFDQTYIEESESEVTRKKRKLDDQKSVQFSTASNLEEIDPQIQEFDTKFNERIEEFVSLVMARSNGKVDNDEIESALTELVQNFTPAKAKPFHTVQMSKEDDKLETDDFDYDADEGEIRKDSYSSTKNISNCSNNDEMKWSEQETTIASLQKQNSDLDARRRKIIGNEDLYLNMMQDWECLDDIPLGREGARMMVTFGDGRNPKPRTVAAILMVARRCLQHAMKDARALRRKLKDEYRRARVAMNLHSAKSRDKELFDGIADCELDPTMCFRALNGRDRLAYESKCGFEVAQLEILFPEEMNEYQKWSKMHQDFKESEDKDLAESENNDKEKDDPNGFAQDQKEYEGGHLRDRLAQFDIRTEQMVDKWYILFAEVRKGSFIRGNKSKDDKEWNENRKNYKNKKNQSKWESLPSSSVQFLHWLGFDERSGIALPRDDVIQALAFLGYDFVGKIVEKAIMLRYLAKCEDEKAQNDGLVLELQGDEQLEIEDIVRALNDTTLNTTALYNASNTVTEDHTAQLYFGPGFEERLELELDNIVKRGNKDKLSDKEIEIRKQEDELFKKLASPPTVLNRVMDVLGGDSSTNIAQEQRPEVKKVKKPYEWLTAMEDPPEKRPKGRPRKESTSDDIQTKTSDELPKNTN